MFKITAQEFLSIAKEYDFLSFPRAVGDPYQEAVFNSHGFWLFVKTRNASKICFTSHNSYPEWDGNYVDGPTITRFGKLFFDFDHKTKPENALLDVKRLASFQDSEGLPWGSTFSGDKGFHDYLITERQNLDITPELWDKVIAVHSWLRYKGEKGRLPVYKKDGTVEKEGRPWLKTLDPKVAEPKRLCRIPMTRHVTQAKKTRDYIVNDRYCIPIKADDLLDADIEAVRSWSKNPIIDSGYIRRGKKLSIDALLEHFDIDVKFWCSIGKDEGNMKPGEFVPVDFKGVPNDAYAIYISKILPRPCVHADLFTENPTHFTRFLVVIQLKEIGMSYEEVIETFDTMADKFKWADRGNRGTMLYQVHHIYYKKTGVGKYWHASCSKIKSKGLCVGKKCPEWFKTEDDKRGNKE